MSPSPDFESGASASSTTSASGFLCVLYYHNIYSFAIDYKSFIKIFGFCIDFNRVILYNNRRKARQKAVWDAKEHFEADF